MPNTSKSFSPDTTSDMPDITIKIENIDKIREAFARYPEIVGPFLRDASMKSAFAVEGQAKLLAPVDTGRLRATIGTSLGIANRGITAIVSTNVFYAIYVHEGTRFMKGRPFMYQAAQRKSIDIQEIYKNQIAAALQKVANVAQ